MNSWSQILIFKKNPILEYRDKHGATVTDDFIKPWLHRVFLGQTMGIFCPAKPLKEIPKFPIWPHLLVENVRRSIFSTAKPQILQKQQLLAHWNDKKKKTLHLIDAESDSSTWSGWEPSLSSLVIPLVLELGNAVSPIRVDTFWSVWLPCFFRVGKTTQATHSSCGILPGRIQGSKDLNEGFRQWMFVWENAGGSFKLEENSQRVYIYIYTCYGDSKFMHNENSQDYVTLF